MTALISSSLDIYVQLYISTIPKVTTYLSPPPEARWRRTSSDSALYQKLTAPSSPTTCPSPTKSEHGSPEYSSARWPVAVCIHCDN